MYFKHHLVDYYSKQPVLFHSVNKLPGGRQQKRPRAKSETPPHTHTLPPRLLLHLPKTHLEFERLHVIGAGSEVSVDQSTTTERSIVRDAILLQSHAVPLAVSAVQALSVAT